MRAEQKIRRTLLITIASSLALSGCASMDYSGVEPRVYNEILYPKTNTVIQNSVYHSFYFSDSGVGFDQQMIDKMDAFLSRTYPSAVHQTQLIFGRQNYQAQRYVTRLLRARGYKKANMRLRVDSQLAPDEVIIELHYSMVQAPDCPDWRKKSSINYSSTSHSNERCASETNLGRQVANPADLQGAATIHVRPDGQVGNAAIDAYRAGEHIGATQSLDNSSSN